MTTADRRPGAKKGSAVHRERIGRGLRLYHAQQRELARIAPWEVTEAARTGSVPQHRRGYVGAAIDLGRGIVNDLGGLERISTAKLALVRGVERCEIGIAMATAHMVQAETLDVEILSKITSLLSTQRALLQALGLERAELEVPSLAKLFESHRENTAQTEAPRANGTDPDAGVGAPTGTRPEPARAEIVAPTEGDGIAATEAER